MSRECSVRIPLTSCHLTATAAVIGLAIVCHISRRATPQSHPASTCLHNGCLLGGNPFVFPPFVLIGPLLRFFIDSHYHRPFTIIVPDIQPRRYWWAFLQATSVDRFLLERKGDDFVLFFPSASTPGWFPRPLQWDLWAFRCVC